MNRFWQTLGIVLGLLLCVCGICTVLLAGPDWVGGVGVVTALAGGVVLRVTYRRPAGAGPELPGAPQRSRQLPLPEQHRDTRLRGRPDQRI